MKWLSAPKVAKKRKLFAGSGFNPLTSLLFPFLLILAFSIICTSLALFQVHRRSLNESLLAQTEVRAHNYRNILQDYLTKRLDTLLNHNRNLASRYDIRQEIQRLLTGTHHLSSLNPLNQQLNQIDYDFGLANISLLDRQGELVFNHGRKSNFKPDNFAVVAALKGHEQSDIVLDGDTWILQTLVPVQDKGPTIGALILTLELNLVLDEFGETNQIGLALADNNGIQSVGNASPESMAIDKETVKQLLADGGSKSIIDLQRNRLFHYNNLKTDSQRFILINKIGLGPIAQILRQKKLEVLYSTLVILGVLLPLSAWIVLIYLRPLIVLRKRAANVAEKLAGISLEDYQGHEIQRLSATFDGMSVALEEHAEARQKAEALLQQEHATLEVKIKERTRDIELTNNLLQREISERTRTQQKAEGLQKLLASFIDAMPSLLIGIDPQGRITQWNLETQRVSGLSLEQVKGRLFHEALPWLKQILPAINLALIQEAPQKLPHLSWVTNSTQKLMDVMIYPLKDEQTGGAVIRLDDVTERVQLDELIMQTEKMMSVGGLAAGMAHEINNPLASIIQSAQVINQRLSPDLPKNIRCAENLGVSLVSINSYLSDRQIPKMISAILDSGQRAGEIVKNMLNFTQGNDALKSVQKVTDILDRAVDHASKDYELRKHHNFQQITVIRDYAEKLPEIYCSAGQLEQVFFNLLQNSAQALSTKDPGGDRPQIKLRITQEEQTLAISLCDNGPGIDMETQKRIFEPFFTTKDVGLGTGLGLSVAYFIISENHGGQIRVDSEPDQGCCFTVLLPINSQPTA